MSPEDLELLELLDTCHYRDTCIHSSVNIIVGHQYYKTIIAWGLERPNDIIPWLLGKLPSNWHWAWALGQIVNQIFSKEERPTFPEGSAGRGKIIEAIWLKWGKEKGYL